MTVNVEWTPEQLLQLSTSYWQAFALQVAVALNVFTLIGDDEMGAEEIAFKMDSHVRGVTMLLNALAAMGLLTKIKGAYSNTDFGKSFLIKDSPSYLGHIIMHHKNLSGQWVHLYQAVRSGEPVLKRQLDDEERKNFLMGMTNMAMGIAADMAKELDFKERRRLIDLAGGPGSYAIHFCLQNPYLRATVYDLPTTKPYAEETIKRFGLMGRIDFAAGDLLKDDIQGTYDVAWLSHILHSLGHDECRIVIDKAVAALEPGGLLLIHDFILDDTFDAPLFAAVFSLNMLVNTEGGQTYSEGQIMEILADAGLKDIQRLPFSGPNNSGIVQGTKVL